MSKRRPREITACVCCGTKGPHTARGLIASCYMRHYRAGTLDQFRVDDERLERARDAQRRGAAKSRALHVERAAARREDYAWLRREQREVVEMAARRVGVTERTAWRYEADLREVS